jgi:ABC-type nitrate/sulfonate/bicarbonate transport system substrate-binding protein
LPAFVAASKGYFTEAGLEVELAQMAAPAAIAGLTNKEIQLSSAGSAVRAAYQGAPLRAVFFYYDRNTFLAVGAPEVKTYRDLRGKVAAVSAVAGSDDWGTKLLLRREGISLDEVNIVVLGQAPQRAAAMMAGQVQFSLMNPDVAVDMERKGFNVLGALGDVFPVPWSGFATHVDTIRDQPDALKAWIRASIRALQLIRDNPGETADIAARELGLDRDVALRAIELQRPAVSADDPGGFTEAGLLLNAEMDLEAMGQAGDPAEFGKRAHDLTLLRQVQREMGIRCTRGYQCQ